MHILTNMKHQDLQVIHVFLSSMFHWLRYESWLQYEARHSTHPTLKNTRNGDFVTRDPLVEHMWGKCVPLCSEDMFHCPNVGWTVLVWRHSHFFSLCLLVWRNLHFFSLCSYSHRFSLVLVLDLHFSIVRTLIYIWQLYPFEKYFLNFLRTKSLSFYYMWLR